VTAWVHRVARPSGRHRARPALDEPGHPGDPATGPVTRTDPVAARNISSGPYGGTRCYGVVLTVILPATMSFFALSTAATTSVILV
jgi:hypothetical protein